MRLVNFSADDVFGYLRLVVPFKKDLTFLIGLNGSGKTTAIRLITALLKPSIRDLVDVSLKTADLEIEFDDSANRTIHVERTPTGELVLTVSGVAERLVLPLQDYDRMPIGSTARREMLESFDRLAITHPVFQAILSFPSAMLLGIDRRMKVNESDASRSSHPDLARRRMIRAEASGILGDVQGLVRDAMLIIREQQGTLDDELRKHIILDAFSYNPSEGVALGKLPSAANLNTYKEKLKELEKYPESLGVPTAEVQSRLTGFFGRLESVIESVSTTAASATKRKGRKRKSELGMSMAQNPQIFEWFINRSQIDRILTLFRLIDEYAQRREAANRPIANFIALVNRFLQQTKKQVVAASQYLWVMQADGKVKDLDSLSSGERQIVVMLAHLSLNPEVAKGGIFIVDEPELSLHIAWQEMFVDAVRLASPGIQLILATHSPAIILDRDENCVDFSKGI